MVYYIDVLPFYGQNSMVYRWYFLYIIGLKCLDYFTTRTTLEFDVCDIWSLKIEFKRIFLNLFHLVNKSLQESISTGNQAI
jgi:hypothetical protein